MIQRSLFFTLPLLLASAPLALAQESDAAHRDRLARGLNTVLQGSGGQTQGLADRFAQTAKAWAYNPETSKQDREALRMAVKGLRQIMSAPQAGLTSGELGAVGEQLEGLIGPQAAQIMLGLQRSVSQEMGGLFAAARRANSDPVNNRPVQYNGKTYTWRDFGGKPILAAQGASLSQGANGRAFSESQGGPGGEGLTEALHGQVNTSNLEGLQPAFREKVVKILKRLQAKGWKPRVAEGLRTRAQQAEKVRKGYSKTMKSYHLKGLAADIIDSRYAWGGPAKSQSFSFWKDLGEACQREDLTWGGNWKSFPDVAHVQDSSQGWNGSPSASAHNHSQHQQASSGGSSSGTQRSTGGAPSSRSSRSTPSYLDNASSLPASFGARRPTQSQSSRPSSAPTLSTAPAGNVAGGQGTLDLIKGFEGFRATPYWDVNAFRAGYGSDTYTTADGRVHRVTRDSRVSRADAERDLARRSVAFQNTVRRQIGADVFGRMGPNTQAALTSMAYNYGSLPANVVRTIQAGAGPAQIAAAVAARGSDNGGINRTRRNQEAELIRRDS